MRAAMYRPAMYVLLIVCFSFSVLSVNGRATKDFITFPDAVYGRFNQRLSVSNSDTMLRPLRQINRRPTGNNRQTNRDDEDIFSGIDTDWVNNNNGQQNSGNRPNGQWSNSGQPNQGSGNRPNGQWSNTGNQNQGSGNRPNSQWSNTGNQNQGSQGFDNNPTDQWSNNGNQNQGSGNRPNGQWSNNGNQNQGSQGFDNNPTDQWSNNGNQNQGSGNRPNGQWSNNGNQNQGGSSNSNSQQSSSSSSQAGQPDRDACNTQCRERVTGEYNPVCGSDAMTYQNRRFLECIRDCGFQTSLSYNGKCITTTERVAVR